MRKELGWLLCACVAFSAPLATHAAPLVFGNVPEANEPGWKLVYTLTIPATLASNWNTVAVPYSLDDSANITEPFDRVAYYMELTGAVSPNPNGWVYVSFDRIAGMTAANKIGVPNGASGERFQQDVSNMNVFASASLTSNNTIKTGTGIQTGNIEFWQSNYSQGNSRAVGAVPNASGSAYDFGDTMNSGNGHGSMQVHNYDLDGAGSGTAGQTLFAFNRWGNAPANTGILDLGIGNRPGNANTDWTSSNSASLWTSRTLEILVHTPEPGSVALAGMSLFMMLGRRRRRE